MSPSPPVSPLKTWHQANCHCGTVRYRVFLPPLAGVLSPHPVMNCNCSLCTRNGYLNVYPQRHEIQVQIHRNMMDEENRVEVVPGSETLRENRSDVLGYYVCRLGPDRENEHVFCKKCGSSLWVDTKGGEEQAKKTSKNGEKDIVAVRMFQDIDVKDLKLEFANGRSWDPQYKI